MPDYNSMLGIFYLVPFFSLICLVTAVKHIYELGKSNTRQRKDKSEIPFVKRLLLSGYVERCKYHRKKAAFFHKIYLVYLFVTIAASILLLLRLMFPILSPFTAALIYGRLFLMDLPINLSFLFFFTRHGKNGGVTYTWTKNE